MTGCVQSTSRAGPLLLLLSAAVVPCLAQLQETHDGKPIVREEHGGGQTTIHKARPLHKARRNVAYEYIRHLETGRPLHPTLEMMLNLNAMAILDAGLRSAVTGKLETVDTASWCVG